MASTMNFFVVEKKKRSKLFSTNSSHWTSIDDTPQPKQENNRFFLRNKVQKFSWKEIEILEQFDEGSQGNIYIQC